MKRKIAIVVFSLSFLCSCSGQPIKFDQVEAHVHLPLMTHSLYGLNAFLFKEGDKEVYLDNITITNHWTLSLLSGEANPIVSFNYREESELAHSEGNFSGEFILEKDGRYRIMGYSSLKTRQKNDIRDWIKEDVGDPIKLPEPIFIGYSDDTTLLVMRVLDYLNEHYTEPVIYSETNVDQRPQFLSSQIKHLTSDTEKEIRKWLLNPPEYYLDKQSLKGVRGKIHLSYLISENGAPCHIKVEHATINKPEILSYIYREIVYALLSMKWQPASLNGENVVIKRNITIKI